MHFVVSAININHQLNPISGMDLLPGLITGSLLIVKGDWAYENQIQIITTSNPGWFIKIGLCGTPLEHLLIDNDPVEHAADDWYFFVVRDGYYKASGDLFKLPFLLAQFKEIVERTRRE